MAKKKEAHPRRRGGNLREKATNFSVHVPESLLKEYDALRIREDMNPSRSQHVVQLIRDYVKANKYRLHEGGDKQ